MIEIAMIMMNKYENDDGDDDDDDDDYDDDGKEWEKD